MIPLIRERVGPAIHDNFKGDEKETLEKELLERQRKIVQRNTEIPELKSSIWGKAKGQLKIESKDKCAYCEAPTSLVAYGDVEHYRPKSVYWWLAYAYENYLVSCQLCNQKYKKAKFPVKNRRLRAPQVRANTTDTFINQKAGTLAPDPLNTHAVQDFIQQHQQERPLLLNPYYDDPVDFYAWDADDTLGEVELIPANPEATPFVKAAIQDYGLNRQELRNSRYYYFKIFRTFKVAVNDPGIGDNTRINLSREIEEMQADHAPFAGMIRYFNANL